jgi:hypothetical protein
MSDLMQSMIRSNSSKQVYLFLKRDAGAKDDVMEIRCFVVQMGK